MMMNTELMVIMGIMLVLYTIALAKIAKDVQKDHENKECFTKQVYWYRKEYGEAKTLELLTDIRNTKSPQKAMNDKIKLLNPTLVNQKI